MRKSLALFAKIAAGAAVLALVAGAALFASAPKTGRSFLADFVSHAASSPDMRVDIGAIDGLASSSLSVRDISLSDRDGIFATIDHVTLDWSRLALLALTADIEKLEIGAVDLRRKPAPAAKSAQTSGGGATDLPLRVKLREFRLDKLTLGAPVLGVAAELSATASAELGAAADGAKLLFTASRRDAPGAYSAKLDLAPGPGALKLSVKLTEPEGGLIARLAQLPGLPKVDVALDGEGPLDRFTARLDAKAGDAIGAQGEVTLARTGEARRVTANLAARIAPLLPKNIAGLFEGETRLTADATRTDTGAATVQTLGVETPALTLKSSGTVDAAGSVDLRVALHGRDGGEGAAFRARTLEGEAHVTGRLDRPDAMLRLLVEDAQFEAGRFEHVDLDMKAKADGPLTGAGAHLDIDAAGHGHGLAFADPALDGAVGDDFSLALHARADGAGDSDIGLAKIETRGFAATFAGKAGPNSLDGKAHVAAPDLRRFARLAGRDLHGALTLGAVLTGAPAKGAINAALDGAIGAPGAGVAAVDGLLGQKLVVSGLIATAAGAARFDKLALRADHVQAIVDGVIGKTTADLTAKLDIPQLHHADARLSGRANIDAALTGKNGKLDAHATAALAGASAEGRVIPSLTLTADAADLTGALRAKATLAGTVDGKAAHGELLAAKAGKGWKLDTLDLSIGRAALKGALTLAENGVASGRLSLAAPDLDDFSALALQRLAGRLDAAVTLDGAGGAQNVAVTAQGAGLRARDAAIEQLSANVSAKDLYRRPLFEGEAALDNAHVGKEVISKARITAHPSGAGAAIDANVQARGFDISGRGVVTPAEKIRIDLSALSVQRGGKKLSLAGPAVITHGGGVTDIRGLAVALGSGRLDIDGAVGEQLDLSVRARGAPLAIAAIADPSLALEGTLDAEARITGSKSAPTGDWKVKLSKIAAPQTRSAGLPAIDAAASGRLSGARTSLDADIALGAASKLKVTGSAPIDGAGGLDLAVKGLLDAALANSMLAAGGQTVAGKATVDMHVTGPAAAPILAGGVTLAGGAFTDPLNGVALTDIAGRIEGRGRDLTIPGLTAKTKNGGALAIAGKVAVAPDAGMPGSIHIAGKNALLASTDVVSATADLDITVSGPLARAPKIGGKVDLVTMEVSVPDRLPANLKALPNTTHIDARGFAAQMLALERKAKEKAGKKSGFNAFLDLALSAPNRIFVRGRGIDAEFSGDLKLTGSIEKPAAIGAFDLRRGKLQLLTQRVDITRGKLAFAGGLTPQLDFAAETQAAEVTARIGVAGPASLPQFTFSSSPELPQDEVLSRLLFAKASGALTPFQAVQLAAALAQFSGATTGVDAFEKMRKALGVDSLDIDAGGAGGPSIGASRYIMEGVSVGVRGGSKPEQAAATVGIDVMKKVRVQGETRMDGKTSVGVGVEWEY